MAIFNSYVKLPEGKFQANPGIESGPESTESTPRWLQNHRLGPSLNHPKHPKHTQFFFRSLNDHEIFKPSYDSKNLTVVLLQNCNRIKASQCRATCFSQPTGPTAPSPRVFFRPRIFHDLLSRCEGLSPTGQVEQRHDEIMGR